MRSPRPRAAALLISGVTAIGVVSSACSGGNDVAARPVPSTTTTTTAAFPSTTVASTTTTAPVPAIITLTPTVTMGESFGEQRGPVTSDPAVVDQLVAMTMSYVNAATIAPTSIAKP